MLIYHERLYTALTLLAKSIPAASCQAQANKGKGCKLMCCHIFGTAVLVVHKGDSSYCTAKLPYVHAAADSLAASSTISWVSHW